jgi:hypothetical protein
VSDRGLATFNENLRLQQVYATLVNFGGAELADRIGTGGSRGGCSAGSGACRSRSRRCRRPPGPGSCWKASGRPTSSRGRSSPARPAPCPTSGGCSWTGCRTRSRRCLRGGAAGHHRRAGGAAGGAVRVLLPAAAGRGLARAGASRRPGRRHRGGRQGAAAQPGPAGVRRPGGGPA